ncbi:MAG: DUF6328 family protein, partial [Blastocatellia bacterium]
EKVQYALDEARLLILGAQVLLGFQYRAVFESGFSRLSLHAQFLKLGGLTLLLIALVLLIWPGAYHRIVVGGEDTEDVHEFTTHVMEFALLPFALALGIDMFVAAEKTAGLWAGIVAGTFVGLMALTCWYGIEAVARMRRKTEIEENESMKADNKASNTNAKLKDKIEHVLTETRVVLPGAQALLGFQLVAILTDGFEKLPELSKYVHLASLFMVAATIVLLMTPAAYHRIVERGEETENFHRFASRVLLAAMVPLALGVCGDFFVVVLKITDSTELAVSGFALMLTLFYGLWFGLTVYWRKVRRQTAQADTSYGRRRQTADKAA